MLRLQEIATTRVADLLAENRLPLDGRFRVSATPANAVFAVLERRNQLKNPETLERLFGGQFNVTTGVDLSGAKCDEETLWRIVQHGIVALNISRATTSSGAETRLLLPRMVACLPADSTFLRNLRSLDMGGSIRCEYFQLLPMINRFESLESLCMSESTDLSNEDLEAVCQHHGRLRLLDLSNCPQITDITCLGRLKHLEVLRLHGLHLDMGAAEISLAFRAWSELTELDISSRMDSSGVDLGRVMLDALDENGFRPFWPRLQTLDLGGLFGGLPRPRRLHRRIERLIDSHHELRNLSTLATRTDHLSITAGNGRQLNVANGGSATNVMNALAFCSKRERGLLTDHALRALLRHGFVYAFSAEECREWASLVASSMRVHSSSETVQEHGAHCLNLIILRHYFAAGFVRFETALLSLEPCMEIVEHALRMGNLANGVCIRVVGYVRIMNIAIKHIVESRGDLCDMFFGLISECYVLREGSGEQIDVDCRVVPIVIDWMRNIMEQDEDFSVQVDQAMAFLSDLACGRPSVCKQIVENDGVVLTFRLAREVVDDVHVYPRALSLLVALARDQSVISHLCCSEFIRPLFPSLARYPSHDQLQRQYDCAAILALLINTPLGYKCYEIDADYASQLIIGLVEYWLRTNYYRIAEMKPIVPDFALLGLDVCAGAQLWALWSIRHVWFGWEQEQLKQRWRVEGGRERLERLLARSSTLRDSGKHLASLILMNME